MEGYCKNGHLRSKHSACYPRKNGKNLKCKLCINAARRLKYRNNDAFRENDKAKSKKYYHTKVKANGQKSADGSSS